MGNQFVHEQVVDSFGEKQVRTLPWLDTVSSPARPTRTHPD